MKKGRDGEEESEKQKRVRGQRASKGTGDSQQEGAGG